MASEEQLTKTVQALETNGIRTVVIQTGEEARAYVLDLIPSGVEVYDSPSRTLEDGFRRIQEYSLPLESERTQQVYGQASAINKMLIVNGEAFSGRITIVLIKQNLGF